MTESNGNNGDGEVKNPGRRRFLKGAAVGIGLGVAGGIGSELLTRNNTSNPVAPEVPTPTAIPTPEATLQPTPEKIEQKKEEGLALLDQFMKEQTTSSLVSDFVKNASQEDMERAVVLGDQYAGYPSPSGGPYTFAAWELRLPVDSTDRIKFAPTVSFVTSELNAEYENEVRRIQVYVDRNGSIRMNLKSNDPNISLRSGHEKHATYDDDPHPGISPNDGYDPFTEEEMKNALGNFATNPIFKDPEGWQVHYRNQETGKVTEITKGFIGDDGISINGQIQETGRITLEVWDKNKLSPKHSESQRASLRSDIF